MKRTIRVHIALLLVGFAGSVIVGCGGQALPTHTEANGDLATPPAFDDSEFHRYPDLERLLPPTVDDHVMVVGSFTPDGSDGAVEWPFDQAFVDAGLVRQDLRIAEAAPSEEGVPLVIVAFQLPGVSGQRLLELLAPSLGFELGNATSMAGKQVLVLDELDSTSWAYGGEQAVYLVGGAPDLAVRVLGDLK